MSAKEKKKKGEKSDKKQNKEEPPVEEFEEMVGEGKFVYPNKTVYIGQPHHPDSHSPKTIATLIMISMERENFFNQAH